MTLSVQLDVSILVLLRITTTLMVGLKLDVVLDPAQVKRSRSATDNSVHQDCRDRNGRFFFSGFISLCHSAKTLNTRGFFKGVQECE